MKKKKYTWKTSKSNREDGDEGGGEKREEGEGRERIREEGRKKQ